jgi:hypothetical protein
MIRHTPKNIWFIIFYLTLWMRRGQFDAEIGRDDFSSIWTIPSAITIGWLPRKSQLRSLKDSPLSLFSRSESVRLLDLCNVERKHEGSRIPHGWRCSGGRYIDLEWSDIRRAPERLPQFDGACWVGHSKGENHISPNMKQFIESSKGSEIARGLRTVCRPYMTIDIIQCVHPMHSTHNHHHPFVCDT